MSAALDLLVRLHNDGYCLRAVADGELEYDGPDHLVTEVVVAAIREARGNLELLAKLLGELDETPRMDVLISTEWLTVRTTLLEALGPHPEARVAAAGALLALEKGRAR